MGGGRYSTGQRHLQLKAGEAGAGAGRMCTDTGTALETLSSEQYLLIVCSKDTQRSLVGLSPGAL